MCTGVGGGGRTAVGGGGGLTRRCMENRMLVGQKSLEFRE